MWGSSLIQGRVSLLIQNIISVNMSFEQKEEQPYLYPFQTASKELILQVWEKGEVIPGYKSTDWRKDRYGKIMHFPRHGYANSQFGWEIDHIYPKVMGGSDELYNLQPLQWQNNREKGDRPIWNCP